MAKGSYIRVTNGELLGIPAAEPVLRLTLNVEAGGMPDRACALFLISGSVHADSGGKLSLGNAAPVLKQLGFKGWEEEIPFTTKIAAEWILSDTAIERIEKIRDGGSLTVFPDFQFGVIGPCSLEYLLGPQKPIGWIGGPGSGQPIAVRVDAHQWVKDVLEQWQYATAVTLVVAIPARTATDEYRTIVSRLATAKQRLTAGSPDDLKASVAASREAVELLRKMRPAMVNPVATKRDLAEREAFILDKVGELAQALFSYDSAASHTDAHLRDIFWSRENAVLALGTAACLAQAIFAST